MNVSQILLNKHNKNVYFYDQQKLDILRNKGFNVLEVWYSDYTQNPDKVLQECLDLIFEMGV